MSTGAKFFLVVLSLGWVAPAWWLGASGVAGQWVLLVLAGIAFVCACFRRRTGARFRAKKWHWLCAGAFVLFLLYLAVQALNPAFAFQRGWPVGRLIGISHAGWLPGGIAGPFSATADGGDGAVPYENAWRYLLGFGGAGLLVFATALGVNRAALLRRWMEVMVCHAALFSLVALAHNVSGSRLTYWFFYDPANRLGGAQFPNGNQQGAYQLVLLALALAAALVRGENIRPFPALKRRGAWLGAAAGAAWLACVSGPHRAGILLGVALPGVALFTEWRRAGSEGRVRIAAWAAAGAAALAAGVMAVAPLRETAGRFGELRADAGAALLHGGSFRAWQHEVALDMWKDAPAYGWGAGCYLYLYNGYYARVPGLARDLEAQRLNRIVFPHADGDWLEFLAEYGIAGTVLLFAPLVLWLGWLASVARRAGPAVWVLAAGVACVLAQAWVDPALRNPVVFSAVAGAAWLAVRLHSAGDSSAKRVCSGTKGAEP